jgi:predicted RNA-binding Zn ribbon-like protein
VRVTVAVSPMPLSSVVDLVNGWGSTPRSEAGEHDLPYPSLDGLTGRLGVGSAALDQVTDEALAEVADLLHPVFSTADRGARADSLNGLLSCTDVRPALGLAGDHLHAAWTVEDPRHVVLAAAAVALRGHLADHPGEPSSDRLGVCEGRRCADVFVDGSPGGRRRFCSVTCQNRARVAAFRSRRSTRG